MKKRKLYIVEDEVLLAKQLEEFLLQEDFEVLGIADSSTIALEQIVETPPDLLLLDICLKNKEDGLQLAETILAHITLPIIFISGCTDAETLQRVKKIPNYGYLMKPFDEQQLKIAIDLALYKHQHEEENRYRRELEKITYSLSHTFRGPVASILGITNLCKLEIKDPQALYFNELVEKNIRKVDDLLKNYFRYSELSRYGALSVRELVWDNFWQELFEDLSFSERNECRLPVLTSLVSMPFYSDTALLKTILQPIVKNTIDFRRDKQAVVHIVCKQHQNGIQIRILDRGIGMSPGNLRKCMELFYRGTEKSEGSGFGLALSGKAIKVLGGRIKIISRENKGCCVSLFIPDARSNRSAIDLKIREERS